MMEMDSSSTLKERPADRHSPIRAGKFSGAISSSRIEEHKEKKEEGKRSIEDQKRDLEQIARTLKSQGICLDRLAFMTGLSRKKVELL